jgi:hypothetical protein
VLAGSRNRELTNRYLHLYLHIMIPTDRRSVAYLANFMNTAWRIGVIELWQLMFGVYILHPELLCSTIRPRSPRTCNLASAYDEFVCLTYLSILSQVFKVLRVHAFPGSKKFTSICCSSPSPLPSSLPNGH